MEPPGSESSFLTGEEAPWREEEQDKSRAALKGGPGLGFSLPATNGLSFPKSLLSLVHFKPSRGRDPLFMFSSAVYSRTGSFTTRAMLFPPVFTGEEGRKGLGQGGGSGVLVGFSFSFTKHIHFEPLPMLDSFPPTPTL